MEQPLWDKVELVRRMHRYGTAPVSNFSESILREALGTKGTKGLEAYVNEAEGIFNQYDYDWDWEEEYDEDDGYWHDYGASNTHLQHHSQRLRQRAKMGT